MNGKTADSAKPVAGFTLLEVMVAMGIIATTLVVVFQSQSQSLSLACDAKFKTTAPFLAQKKMAELEMLARDDLFSDSGSFEDFPDYKWKVTVEDPSFSFPQNVSNHLKQIDLILSWGEDDFYSYRLRQYRFFPQE